MHTHTYTQPLEELANGLSLRDPVKMRLTFIDINRTRSVNGELVDFRAFPLIRETGERDIDVSVDLEKLVMIHTLAQHFCVGIFYLST